MASASAMAATCKPARYIAAINFTTCMIADRPRFGWVEDGKGEPY